MRRRGLRLPSLESDVHSTCWFFKQLCPQKFRKSGQAARPSVFGRHWGGCQGMGVGAWCVEPELVDSVSLSLSLFLSLPSRLTDLCLLPSSSLFVLLFLLFSLLPFFPPNSPVICLIEPKCDDLSEFVSHTLHDMWWRGSLVQNNLSLKASVTSPQCDNSHLSDPKVTAVTDISSPS